MRPPGQGRISSIMNIFGLFEKRVADAVGRLADSGRLPAELDTSRVVVEPPRDASHGDLATNAAMVLAKEARMSPRALADLLAGELTDDPSIVKLDVAGPGFINLTLAPALFHDVLRAAMDPDFGRSGQGRAKRSTWSTCRRTPPVRCMWAMAAAPSSETPSISWLSPATG